MRDMVAHQRYFGCGAIYHVIARYLVSHIYVNLCQLNSYLALETTIQVVFLYLPSPGQEALESLIHCHTLLDTLKTFIPLSCNSSAISCFLNFYTILHCFV